jgi:hypothetical protein
MRIKDDKFYELYVAFLKSRNYNSGQMRLAEISAGFFEDFKRRLEDDPHFNKEINLLYLNLRRKDLIKEILDVETLFS